MTKVSGIYALIRLSRSVFGPNESLNSILMFVGAVSIVMAVNVEVPETPMYVQTFFLHCIMPLKCCNILIYFEKTPSNNQTGLCNKFCI